MRLRCPGCRGVFSLEAWINEPNVYRALKLLFRLPDDLPDVAVPYMKLFRPMKNQGLRWGRLAKLAEQLSALIRSGHVQWKRNPARPCNTKQWEDALARMIDNPPNDLPLKNHNYLKSVAYTLADRADREAETRRNKAERAGCLVHSEREDNELVPIWDIVKGA